MPSPKLINTPLPTRAKRTSASSIFNEVPSQAQGQVSLHSPASLKSLGLQAGPGPTAGRPMGRPSHLDTTFLAIHQGRLGPAVFLQATTRAPCHQTREQCRDLRQGLSPRLRDPVADVRRPASTPRQPRIGRIRSSTKSAGVFMTKNTGYVYSASTKTSLARSQWR